MQDAFIVSRDGAGWIRSARYSPNGLLIACGMGGETTGMSGGMSGDESKRHSPREEDGTIKIVSGERREGIVLSQTNSCRTQAPPFLVVCARATTVKKSLSDAAGTNNLNAIFRP